MFAHWANLVLAGKKSDLLIIMLFVTEKDVNSLGIALVQRQGDLLIAFSRRRNV